MNTTEIQADLFKRLKCGEQPDLATEVEIWKSDPQFPDYQFSNLGRARSFRGHRVRYFYGTPQRGGHRSIELQPGRHQEFLHRMIARLFLGTCPEGMIVRHINGNPNDNRLANLAYGTPQQNSVERYKHAGTYTGRRSRVQKNKRKEKQIQDSLYAALKAEVCAARNNDFMTIPISLGQAILSRLGR